MATGDPFNIFFQKPSLRQQLQLAIQRTDSELGDLQRALELYDENPGYQELSELLQRIKL